MQVNSVARIRQCFQLFFDPLLPSLNTGARKICSIIFLEPEIRLTALQFPGSFFLPLIMGATFAF